MRMFVTSRPSLPAVCIAAIALSGLAVTEANAVSTRVKFACARDYMANCRAFKPDTPEVRSCMNKAGPKLSSRCVNALVAAGEVSKAEVSRRPSLGN